LDINKKLKQKHKKAIRNKRIENIIYKALTPLIKLSDYIEDKKYKRIEKVRDAGRNMTIDKATDIAIELIIDKLVKWEKNIELIVADYSDTEYFYFTTFKWILRYIPSNGKRYEMLKCYIYKNERYSENAIDINREFTEAVYEKIKDIPNISAEWVVDKEEYGYWKSKNYEKTLVIGLKGVNNDKEDS
jgi:hypothetical protein